MSTTPNIRPSTEPSNLVTPSARWFDGWRIVTGTLATLFFGIGILGLASADAEHKRADECTRNYDSSCYEVSDDWALMFLIVGVWMMAFAICFGLATMAPFGARRRAWLIAPIGILVGPWVIGMAVYVAVSSPIVSAVLLAITAVFIILVRVEDRRKARGTGNARSQR